MASLTGFNAAEVEPNQGFEALPAGDYVAIISDSEMKPTSAGTGEYLKLTLEIVEGQYKGRKIFENLNLSNPNEEAVRIARGTLSAICRAVNVLAPKDSVELHNIPMTVRLGLRKRDDTGEMQNKVNSYKPKSSQQTSPPNPGGPAPWQKKVG